ncbi:MAG: right-handed parallel beta-helix repeat-containing protein [Chloroflexi bacterium]|nr:right-handed parallel beta-helix repeat-containing protein [Chloroflexota bacterium]MCI0644180.1 right-handed parallel beta-helix repeat-containing protein [Chloroflexota bacterium]MCI0725237.1 right-handed parallel beta-helix repeat-containing protein [Chloroflexota bacterium]
MLAWVLLLMNFQLSPAQAAAPETVGATPEAARSGATAIAGEIPLAGQTLYVTADATGVACTPAEPCPLQVAANQALDGDEIRVAGGLYDELLSIDGFTQTLRLETSITIRGGYTSTNWLAEPDPVANETILDGLGQARVVYIVGPIQPTITGFAIRNGEATEGAGVYHPDANGGAVIEANQIYDNVATGGTARGGGVFLGGPGTVTNNDIYNNSAAGRGGGVFVENLNTGGDTAVIQANKIHGNSAGTVGSNALAGGLGIADGNVTVDANEIYQNTADFAAGILVDLDGNVTLQNNVVYLNTATFNNSSAGAGGGLLTRGTVNIWHNTFAKNSATNAQGGGIYLFGGTAVISNTIVAHNTAASNSGIHELTPGIGSGGFNNIFNNTSNATGLVNTIITDPLFVSLAGNDFHLTAASLNINAGDPSVPVNTDFDNQVRPFDGGIDVGADEFYDPANTCYARFNNGPVFDTIDEAMALVTSPSDVVKVAGRCTGTGSQVVLLTQTFTLQGGYTTTNWVERGFGPTIIDAEGVSGRRGIHVTAGSPTIDSLRVTGGNLASGNGAGIYAAAGSPTIQNAVLYDNSAPSSNGALGVGSGASATLRFLTIADNSADGVRFEGSGSLHNSIVYNNTGVAIGGGSGHTFNLVNVNPLFANAPAGDYHITAASPAMAIADPATTLAEDFEGDSRPSGFLFDVGADEANDYPAIDFRPALIARDVNRGFTYTFTHVLTNAGTLTDSYNLAGNNSAGWSISFPGSISNLPPGQSTEVPVIVQVPAGASPQQVATTTVTATSTANTNVYAVVEDVATVLQLPSIAFTPSYSDTVLPGTVLTYVHTLTNTGDYTDTFVIAVASDPFNWVELLPTDPQSVTLPAGGVDMVQVRVEVPPFASSGFANEALIRATSVFSPVVTAVVTDRVTAKATVGTRYVSPGGVDLNNNCTQTSFPCATVARGVSQASFEDQVRVATGTYLEININVNDTISVTGGWVNDFTEQQGPETTIIDANQQNRIFIIAPGSNIQPFLGNFTLRDGLNASVGGAMIVGQNAQPQLSRIIFDNNQGSDGGALYLQPGANVLLEKSRFVGNTATRDGGAVFVQGATLSAENNLFDSNVAQRNGGALYTNGGQVTVVHNTIHENAAATRGGGLYNNGATVAIANTILVSNTATTGGGAVYQASGATTLDYDDVWNNSVPETNVPVGANSISADPDFADALFRLQASSPAVDTADPASTVGEDFEDDPRPVDQGFDMGWDERAGCLAKRGEIIYGSIQAAIEAGGIETLILVSGYCRGVHPIVVNSQTISQTVDLDESLTIQGGWDSTFATRGFPTYVDPEGRGRAFYVSGSATPVLEDLILLNGDAAGLGGGPAGEDAGGAIYNADSDLTLVDMNVFTSTAGVGGGVYNDTGLLTVTYAIDSQSGSISRTVVASNTAVLGAGLFNNAGQMIVQSAHIRDNQATTGGALANESGALYAENSLVWDNSATGNGGAVYGKGQVTLLHLTFYENTAGGSGEAVYQASGNLVARSNIFQGDVASLGAAIHVAGGSTDIDYNYYYRHTTPAVTGAAEGPNSINSTTPPGLINPAGGDFHLFDSAPAVDQGDLNTPVLLDFEEDLRPSNQSSDMGADEVANCYARVRSTGIIYGNVQSAVDVAPVGDWVDVAGKCTGVHTIDAGGLGVISQTVHLTKNVNLQGGWTIDFSSQTDETILDALGMGRVIYAGPAITSTIDNFNVTGGNGNAPGLNGNGGAIYLDNAQASLQRNEIYTNTASNGAGIYISSGSAAVEAGNRIFGNTATNGGAIYLAGTATVVNNFIYLNTATTNGGAVYQASGNSSFWHNDLVQNTANNSGGGLFVAGGSPSIRSNIVMDNDANVGGGGAHGSGGAPSLGYNDFYLNTPANFGGTIAGGGSGNLSVDPLFTDLPGFDLTITVTSPVIDKGDPALSLEVDFEDDIRPSQQGFDVGADEIGGCYAMVVSSGEIYGSPQLAIDVALNNDTILIDGTCYGVNGQLVSATTVSQTVFLNKNLTIDGDWDSGFLPAGTPAIFDALGLGRTVYVDTAVTVVVKDLELRNGDANATGFTGNGGAVYNTGVLSLTEVLAHDSTAINGGGVYNAGGQLTIEYSRIATNTVTGGGGGVYHNAGSLLLHKSDIYNNDAANGAGIYLNSSAGPNPAVQNNFIYDNQATANGGGLYNANTTAAIWHNTFVNNGATGSGGGIYTTGGSSVVIRNDIVDSNSGTGIHASGAAPNTGYNNVIGNSGGNYGGTAVAGAGAISAPPDYVDPANNDFHLEDDTAGVDVGDPASPVTDDYDDDVRPSNAGFDMGADEVNSCLIRVVDPSGPGTRIFGVLQFAIDYAEANNFTLVQIARGECKGVRQDPTSLTWQVGYVRESLQFVGSLRRLDFSDPNDFETLGTLTTIINAENNGRVLHIASGASPTFLHLVFVNGDAAPAGGGTNGGAIYSAGDPTFVESFISQSSASNGGGYYGAASSHVSFRGGEEFDAIPPDLDGRAPDDTILGDAAIVGFSIAALVKEDETGQIIDITFKVYTGNVALNNGGGIYNAGDMYVSGVSFFLNSAGNQGGGLYNNGPDFEFVNVLFWRNQATNQGGGIYNSGSNALFINGVFQLNESLAAEGGAIYNANSIAIYHNTIRDNTAQGNGGGIFNSSTSFVLNSTIVYSNASTLGTGGGLNSVANPGVLLSYNNFYNNLPNDSTVGIGSNSISAQPQFEPLSAWRLLGSSPDIDRADPALVGSPLFIDFDIELDIRPDGGITNTIAYTSDIGADEYPKNFGCSITPDNFSLADPGETVTYTHTVANSGNYTDIVTITLTSTSQGWATLVGGPQVVALGANESVEVEVEVVVPFGVLAGVQDVSVVQCQSTAIPDQTDTATDITEVAELRGVIIIPDYITTAVPGQVLTFTHTIINIGNISDTFRYTPNSGPAYANAVIVNPLTDTVFLVPSQSITIDLQVTIFDDAMATGTATPGAVVRSVTEPTIFDAALDTILIGYTSGTRYVAAENSADTTNCTNFQNPCATIQHAVDQAVDGDAILVALGTYTDSQTSTVGQHNVHVYKSLSIDGGYDAAEDYATSEPITNAVILDGEGARRVIYVDAGLVVTISSLFIQNGVAPTTAALPEPGLVPVARVLLQPNAGGGIYNDGADLTLNGVWLLNNTAEFGGGLYHLTNTLHLNSVVLAYNGNVPGTNGEGGGVYAAGGDVLVENGTFAYNDVIVPANLVATGSGGGLYQANGSLVITNTIFLSNTASNYGAFFGPPATSNDYNLTFGNSSPETNVPLGSNSFSADPLIADGFFHLAAGSPAIDEGTDLVTLGFDIDRQPRRQGPRVDIGADEYLQVPDFVFVPVSQTATISSGVVYTYSHVITNTGDFTDSYSLAMNNQTTGGTGWGYFLTPTLITDLPVEASVQVTFVITGGSPGYVDTTVITATSATDPLLTRSVVDTTIISQTAGVDIEPSLSGSGLPGEVITYNHILTNTGDGPDTYTLTVTSAVPPGWNITITPSNTGVVLPGATLPFTVAVEIPATAVSGTVHTAQITAISGANPVISDTLTDTTTVEVVYGLTLTPDNVASVPPGTAVVYTHTLASQSNLSDTVNLTVTSLLGWPVSLSDSVVNLPPFGSQIISVTVTVPVTASIGISDTAIVTATSSISPSLVATATNTTFVVSQTYGVDIEPDRSQNTPPSTVIVYTHTVTNTGNGQDIITLAAASSNGWGATITPTQVTLSPQQSTPVTVTLSVPAVPLGTLDTMVVTATSTLTSVFDTVTDTTLVTDTVPGAGVLLEPDLSATGLVSDFVVYNHVITNTGDSADTFDLVAQSSQAWPVTVNPTNISLAAGQSAPVVMQIFIPPGTLSGTVDVTVITATSTVNPAVFDTATDTTTVTTEPVAGVSLVPNNSSTAAPGDTVVYNHTLTNLGNNSDTFTLAGNSSQSWSVTVLPSVITLLAGENRGISVTVVVPPSAPSGTVDITLVTATSGDDPGVTDSATDTTTVIGAGGLPELFLPIIFQASAAPPPPPTPTPTPTPTNTPPPPACTLNVPPPANPPGIDLVITNMTIVPNPPGAGQPATIFVTIKNQGQTDVPYGNNFYLDFYDNPNPEPPQPLQIGNVAWGVQGVWLNAGASVVFQSPYVFGSGQHRLWAQVDTDGTVVEANEGNNLYGCLALAVTGAGDLAVTPQPPSQPADLPRSTPTSAPLADTPVANEPPATPVPGGTPVPGR